DLDATVNHTPSLHDALPICDIAMTRSAPWREAASTAHRPTAPSPTTTTVSPGATRALTAACQPVPMTSDSVSSDGSSASSGGPRSEEHTSELQSRETLVCRL